MIDDQSSKTKRLLNWITIAGLIVAIGSLLIAIRQLRLDSSNSKKDDQANSTLIGVLNEQLDIQEQLFDLQSESAKLGDQPEQTEIAKQVENLRETQRVLQVTVISLDSSYTLPEITSQISSEVPTLQLTPTNLPERSENKLAVISTFDGKSLDGWSAFRAGFINPGTGGSGGGTDNGCLIVNEDKKDTGYFVAPQKFLGNWIDFSYIKFDMWSSGGDYFTSKYGMYGDVYIVNGFATAQYMLPYRPSNQWETFEIPLNTDDNWVFSGGATTLSDVLVNVTDFQIRAEYGTGADKTGLDNVILE